MSGPVNTRLPGSAPGRKSWYIQCYDGSVQNATFVSSADHQATSSAEGNVPDGLFSSRATRSAGRPWLFLQLFVLACWAIGCPLAQAGESDQPASTVPTSIASTNSAAATPEAALVETNSLFNSVSNSLSLSVQWQPVITNSLTTATNRSLHDWMWSTTVFALEKADDDGIDLFSDQVGNGHFGIANFQAGYGQVYDSDSIVLRGRNGTSWEEPRYLFVKKVIKF